MVNDDDSLCIAILAVLVQQNQFRSLYLKVWRAYEITTPFLHIIFVYFSAYYRYIEFLTSYRLPYVIPYLKTLGIKLDSCIYLPIYFRLPTLWTKIIYSLLVFTEISFVFLYFKQFIFQLQRRPWECTVLLTATKKQ